MPVTRSQTLSKEKNMSEPSATDAAWGDSSSALRARSNIQRRNEAGNISSAHPGGKGGTLEKEAQSKEKKKISEQSYYCKYFIFVALAVLVVLVVMAMVVMKIVDKEGQKGSEKHSVWNSNMAIVEENIDILQENFSGQEEDLWEVVKAAVDYHFNSEPDPECPIILMFGSHPNASKTSRCLVEKLGRTLSQVMGEESLADSLYEIDGEVFQSQNADDAKLQMDHGLRKAFKGKPGKKSCNRF